MSTPTSLPSFDEPRPSRADQVSSTLTALGLEPEVDEDGDLQVMVNDQKLYVRTSDDGPGLVRVFGQWKVMPDVEADHARKRDLAHEVTAAHALVKVNFYEVPDDPTDPGHLVVTLDQIAPEGTRYELILPPMLDAVLSGVRTWHHLLVEHAPGQERAE